MKIGFIGMGNMAQAIAAGFIYSGKIDGTDPFEIRFNTLKQYISQAQHITFFGGAGVSVGSGIPDFRSKNGKMYSSWDSPASIVF